MANRANRFAVLGEDLEEEEDEEDGDAERGVEKIAAVVVPKAPPPRRRAPANRHGLVLVGIIVIASVVRGQISIAISPRHNAAFRPQNMSCVQFSAERRYVITNGKQLPLRRGIQPMVLQGVFHGRCYSCKCLGHSQKWCPIRRCKICGEFGHSDAVCAANRASFC